MRRQFALLCATTLAILPLSLAPARAAGPANAPSVGGLPSGSYTFGNRQNGEIVSKRTRTSRTFAENGHYVTSIYQSSVNYQDAQGNWQPINNTLTAATRPGYAFQNKANRYTVDFPSDIGSVPIHVEMAGSSLDFSLVGASGAGSVSGDTDTFTIPGAAIAFTAGNDLLKETVTLSGPTSPSIFVYNVAMSAGLTARQNATGGIDFVDGARQSKFSFAAPFVYDHSGLSSASSSAVSMKLTQGTSGATVTISVDPAWLADSSRVWPVTIDPTVTFNPTLKCRIRSSPYADTNACGYLEVGHRAAHSPYPAYTGRSLLQFDLSSLPADAQILNADLAMYSYTSLIGIGAPQTIPMSVYQVTRSWTSGVTWNKYDGTNAWTTAGGDFSATASATNNNVGLPYGWYHWYPTQLVQGWVNGTIANDGMIVKEPSETPDAIFDFDTTSNLPFLKISYQSRVGAQSFYTIPQRQLTDVMGLSVNIANGNAIVNESDLYMQGVGLPLSVGRTYNNQSTGMGDLGNGWAMNTGRDVGLGFFPDGSATFYGPSGYQTPFIKNPDGSFTSPTGADSTLVQNGDGTFTMTFHGSGEQYTFSSGGYFLSDVDRSGNKLSFGYDGSNRLSSITDTQGRLTSFLYNASSLITQMTDPANRTYGYAYDTSNNLVSYTDPAGKVAQFVYDVNHNLTQITDPVGNVTKLVYDLNSRVTSITYVTNPSTGAGFTTTLAYNSGNTVVTDPNGHASTYYFDTTDRVTSTKDPLTYVRQLTWTADSHISQAKQPSGATTTATFDANNNPTQVTAPTGAATKAQYGNGSLPYSPTSVTDTAGNTSTIQYTGNGLPSSTTDPQNHTASVSYNSNGTVASQTDENGNVTSDSYFPSGTSLGLLNQVTPPTPLGSHSYTYNSSNQVATQTDGKGQLTSYSYDQLGRLTSIGYADGTSIGYAYDADGDVLAMTDGRGTTSYSYDALNRLTQEAPPSGGATSYTYDGVDNLLSKSDSSGTISYTYTADGQLASVKDQYNATTMYSYDQDGNQTQISYSNGAKQTFSYDSAGEATALTALSSTGATLASMSWSYTNPTTHQPTGMVYSKTDVAGNTTSNTYDSLDQLTSATTKNSAGTTLHSYSYSYDPAGNLASKTMDGTTTPMTYNAANELTQAGTKTLSYDPNGSRIGDSTGASYTYNAAGQMATLTPAGGTAMTMTYAGPGQNQRVAAGSKTYQYDQTGMKQFYNGTGTSQITMTPKGTPVGYRTGGNTFLYLVNPVDGSIVGIYSADGQSLKNVVIYTPTGDVIDGSQLDPANAMGWQMLDVSDGSTDNGGGCFEDPTTATDTSCNDSSGGPEQFLNSGGKRRKTATGSTRVWLVVNDIVPIGYADASSGGLKEVAVGANMTGWKRGRLTLSVTVWRDGHKIFHDSKTCGDREHARVTQCDYTTRRIDDFVSISGEVPFHYFAVAKGCGPGGCSGDTASLGGDVALIEST